MAEELFDIVNERDEPVGQASRQEAHRLGLKHRAVHILIFNAEGKVFLQKRSREKDVAPGLWDSSCSGHVDAGEDYDAAARRELAEELGLRVAAPPAAAFCVAACPQTGQEFVWVYRLAGEGPFVLQPSEIDEGQWLEPGMVSREVAELSGKYSPAFRFIWGLAVQR
jgi:isopentenyl-diphosphate delta-isomerase type 1